jgi:hypothetical protein
LINNMVAMCTYYGCHRKTIEERGGGSGQSLREIHVCVCVRSFYVCQRELCRALVFLIGLHVRTAGRLSVGFCWTVGLVATDGP